jgi:magnesium transporter
VDALSAWSAAAREARCSGTPLPREAAYAPGKKSTEDDTGRQIGMDQLFGKSYHPPGTAPGTLRKHDATQAAARVYVVRYNDDGIVHHEDCDLDECLPLEQRGVLWCHLQGQPTPEQLARLREIFALHPLAVEDVGNPGQRPKADIDEDSAFVILNHPRWEDDGIVLDQVSLFLGRRFVVTVQSGPDDSFAPIRRRIGNTNRNFRTLGAPYLAYAVIDMVVDQAFPIMEELGSRIADLEDRVLDDPERSTYEQIHLLRRELLVLRRHFWPARDMLGRLMRDGADVFGDETVRYLRDVHDHTIQIMDILESYREMTASMVDAFISAVNHRLNEVMKVLTIIATIFIPLTFLVGVYGMNFANPDSPWAMPELHTYYGYPLLWLVMVAVAGAMVYFFRRRGWF